MHVMVMPSSNITFADPSWKRKTFDSAIVIKFLVFQFERLSTSKNCLSHKIVCVVAKSRNALQDSPVEVSSTTCASNSSTLYGSIDASMVWASRL